MIPMTRGMPKSSTKKGTPAILEVGSEVEVLAANFLFWTK
ncbi:hypothetical protein SOVF_074800 [Spinacia oleracea]|nr:hypothetical protein SOVF_074800 [Spinacia oleracea]